jgi:hypothetical protein
VAPLFFVRVTFFQLVSSEEEKKLLRCRLSLEHSQMLKESYP